MNIIISCIRAARHNELKDIIKKFYSSIDPVYKTNFETIFEVNLLNITNKYVRNVSRDTDEMLLNFVLTSYKPVKTRQFLE